MRVGSEGVGGTPYDATGAARAGEAKPGAEATFAGAGFFELLALLQGATPELTPASPDAEGSDEVIDDEIAVAAPDGTQGPPAGLSATDQAAALAGVVVTLSSDAVAAAAAASSGAAVVAGSSVATGVRGGVAGGAPAADPVLGVQGGDGQVARAPSGEGASVATVGPARAVVSEPSVDAAVQPPPQPAAPQQATAAAGRPLSAQKTGALQPVAPANPGVPTPVEPRADVAVPQHAQTDHAPSRQPVASAAQAYDPAGFADAFRDGHAADAGDEQDPGDWPGRAENQPGVTTVKGFAAVIERARDVAPTTTTATLDAAPSRDELTAARDTRAADPGTQPAAHTLRASLRGGEGTEMPSWIERLTSPQRLALSRNADALTFDLEPNGLGRIEVRLSFGRDGVRAQVFAEHEHTRTLLVNQQPALAAAFERNDLRLESFLVDLGLGADGQQDARSAWDEMNAFDQIGLVSSSTGDDVAGDTVSPATTLLSVRA